MMPLDLEAIRKRWGGPGPWLLDEQIFGDVHALLDELTAARAVLADALAEASRLRTARLMEGF